MKKIFAFMLVLAMLLPMGLVPVANAEGEVTAKPFYTLNWNDIDNSVYPYLDGLVWARFNTSGDKATIKLDGLSNVLLVYNENGLDENAAMQIAQKLKTIMDARPEGMRYLHLFYPRKVYALKVEAEIYMDYGVNQLKALTEAVLKAYKEVGGKLDGLVLDVEYEGIQAWNLNLKDDDDPLLYNKIVSDPRYATEIRPLLAERGFKFWPTPSEYTPEIYGICNSTGSAYDHSRNVWDIVIRIHLNRYCNKWAYEPLQKYFPEASLSDYQSTDNYSWLKQLSATDNGQSLDGGNSFKVGDTSTFSFYHAQPKTEFFTELKKYASYNDAIFEATAFSTMLYYINFAKSLYSSTDTKQFSPWLCSYVYNSKKATTLAYTPYYTEEIYHLGMLDPDPFLCWAYTPDYTPEEWELTWDIMNAIMAELTRVAGYSDRKPIETGAYWNSEFVISGMYANGRNIWRISPNNNRISVADFKVSGTTDPTFYVEGQTITFPGGKIIEDSVIPTAGSYGYWVETSKDVTPIVTREEYYFAKYPSLSYDFEDCTEGVYDNNSHTPITAWEFTWMKGASTTIEKVGDNKVLALKGNAEVRSAKLPGNITAGDTYAEDQAWQITVTIPEGLTDEAVLSLLYYAGTNQKIKDGGFRITGGKLYYGTIGTNEEGKAVQEYKELMDITPGTYIFRREVNFNNKEDYRSNFAVYDATGKELKSVTKVATPVFKSITTINFATKDIDDKPVYLDNYFISLIGTAADFEIYDAALGVLISDDAKETPRDRSTAYRLSWLNATTQDETATVMAAFYNGSTLVEEKVLKEVKLTAGYDGVETGVVDVAEGQTVKVYLKTTIKTGEEPPVEEPKEEPKEEKDGLSIGVIAVIAAAVVAVIGVVVILLVAKKPAPKANPTEEKTEE